jgi:hypothetical protein
MIARAAVATVPPSRFAFYWDGVSSAFRVLLGRCLERFTAS